MNLIYIGDLVNTHGIKGEVRIISESEYKDKIFVKDHHLYINDEQLTINTYRKHKCFDMVTFNEYSDINDVIKFKGLKVYADKDEIVLNNDELFLNDYISMRCIYKNKTIGYIEDVINNNGYKLFLVNSKYIPMNDNFIEKVDIESKTIYFKNLEGLLWKLLF